MAEPEIQYAEGFEPKVEPGMVEVECIVQCLWSHSNHDQEDVTEYQEGDKVSLPLVTAKGLQTAGIVKIQG